MANDEDSLFLPLRPQPAKTRNEESISALIAQIGTQKGHLRNVTESSLLTEIKSQDEAKEPTDDASMKDAAEEEESAKSRKEIVYEKRDEMIRQATIAYTESHKALDFISVLLTKAAGQPTEQTITLMVKELVPPGSVGSEFVRRPDIKPKRAQDVANVCKGWKMDALNDAATSLFDASTKLEEDMQIQAKWFEQLLEVKKKGWDLRHHQRKHSIGVKFGFANAAPAFKDRGTAILHRDSDGKVVLDDSAVSARTKAIRVRIRRGKTILGTSSYQSLKDNSLSPIELSISQARDAIFEDELFHEINREARNMSNIDVRSGSGTVHLPYRDSSEILIDHAPVDEFPSAANSSPSGIMANAIALGLRLLLSHSHRRNFRRRTGNPLPILESQRSIPPYAILRPLLNHLQHSENVERLQSHLSDLHSILDAAELRFQVSLSKASSMDLPQLLITDSYTKGNKLPLAERLLSDMSAPVESKFTIILPSAAILTLTVRTNMDPPTMGTAYAISTTGMNFAPPFPTIVRSTNEARDLVVHLTTLDLANLVVSISSKPQYGLTEADKSGKAAVSKGAQKLPQWKPSVPHDGELILDYETTGRSKILKVAIEDEGLSMRWTWMDGDVDLKKEFKYIWKRDQGASQQRCSFDVVLLRCTRASDTKSLEASNTSDR